MKAHEFNELSETELNDRLEQAYAELFNIRFQLATRQIQNYARAGHVRRDVARIKTVLRERALGIR